jgi:hypothetical protein
VASETPESAASVDSREQAAGLIQAFVDELTPADGGFFRFDLKSLASVQTILALPRDQQVPVVMEAVTRQAEETGRFARRRNTPAVQFSFRHLNGFEELIGALLRRKLSFQPADIERLIRAGFLGQGILRVVESFCEQHGGVPDHLRPGLTALRERLADRVEFDAEARKAIKRLDDLLAPPAATLDALLTTDEAWTRHLRAQLGSLSSAAKVAWQALLLHCNTASSSKPSGKWLKQAEPLIQEIGTGPFSEVLKGTLAEIGQPGVAQRKEIYGQVFILDETLIHDTHSDLFRGLVWCASLVEDDGLTVAVGDAAAACFKKLPNVGPRSPKIGNACLYSLSASSSPAAVGQLSRLKTRAKHASVRKQLEKALDTAADKTGMSAAEMEEVAVPTCGLTEVGVRRQQLGDSSAVLKVEGMKAELTWLGANGKPQKSAPAAVKKDFADDLKALKQSEKELAKLLPAQRSRLEQLYLQERTWSFPEFRIRYLDHPLVGTLARRLIWRYTEGDKSGDGGWLDGRVVDDQDRPLDWLGVDTRVAPWHPLTCGLEQVRAWREWLERHDVRQPFKQAHREIYILTDAERQTGIYSNRFAAHVIRQHQFQALCQERGWRYTLQGNWDSANTPTLRLPQWDLRVEFWVQAVADNEQVGHTGVYLHLSTDQVRFYRGDDVEPLSLAEVPPLVFTEVLRDVDLFVGVASVGNDPNWSDGGPHGLDREYWQRYSFGELSATAQTRRAVLERIIPRLKIADRCSFDDKFLVVRGDLRTYKIHPGSGNILMSPNDQYLCIVPKPSSSGGATGKVHLPFEGDHLLSIILSKAFLLAEDSKIKDPTIVSQIGRK